MENLKQAAEAQLALSAEWAERMPGFCLRWVRECVQHAYGNNAWPAPLGLDAAGVMGWALRNAKATTGEGYGMIGNILFYTGPEHGIHGHVVIRIPGNQIAENSVVHFNGTFSGDARGVRPLESLGIPTAVWDFTG
jgi:hypothetical protein